MKTKFSCLVSVHNKQSNVSTRAPLFLRAVEKPATTVICENQDRHFHGKRCNGRILFCLKKTLHIMMIFYHVFRTLMRLSVGNQKA